MVVHVRENDEDKRLQGLLDEEPIEVRMQLDRVYLALPSGALHAAHLPRRLEWAAAFSKLVLGFSVNNTAYGSEGDPLDQVRLSGDMDHGCDLLRYPIVCGPRDMEDTLEDLFARFTTVPVSIDVGKQALTCAAELDGLLREALRPHIPRVCAQITPPWVSQKELAARSAAPLEDVFMEHLDRFVRGPRIRGLILTGPEMGFLRSAEMHEDFYTIVTGTRLRPGRFDNPFRRVTPEWAMRLGAQALVIDEDVWKAPDPAMGLIRVLRSMNKGHAHYEKFLQASR